MSKLPNWAPVATALSLIFLACGPKSSGSNTASTTPAPAAAPAASSANLDPSACATAALTGGFGIVDGTPVCPTSLVAQSTVILYDSNGDEMCTATRIGPNQLVTAAHCLEQPVPGMQIGYLGAPKAQGPQAPDPTTISTLNAAGTAAIPSIDPSLQIVATVFHPLFDTTLADGSDNNNQDIGMVVFSGTMPVTITQVAAFADFPTTAAALAADTSPTLLKAGFGKHSSEDNTGDDDLESVVLTIASVDPAHGEFSYAVGSKKGTCNGDSGGPGYFVAGSTLKLLGVTSRAPDNLTTTGTDTDGCDNGNGIDTDARYYRAWLSCVSQRVNALLGTANKLQDLSLSSDAADTSAQYCAQTVVQSTQQFIAATQAACNAQPGKQYNAQTGSCKIVTAAACTTAGGTWTASSSTCALDD